MAQTKPFFSIIIPALNEERYLPNLLNDLVHQSYHDFEVIIVDGKSEDKTVAQAKKFARLLPKLTILTSNKRHVCTQRNLGSQKAKGDVLVFFDSDERIDANFLMGIHYQWDKCKVDLLTTWIAPDTNNPSDKTIALAINLFTEMQLKLRPTYLLESMLVISRKAFQDIGGFDPNINMSEGRWLLHSLIDKGYRYAVTKEPMHYYSFRRIHKYGAWGLAHRISQYELRLLFGIKTPAKLVRSIYPMNGGNMFNDTQDNLVLALNQTTRHNRTLFKKKMSELIKLLNTDVDPKNFPKLKKQLKKFLS